MVTSVRMLPSPSGGGAGWERVMSDTIERRSLSLTGARRVLDAALNDAEQRRVHVSVAVLGSEGQLKAFAAMDGTSILSTETARKKALTVIKVGKATNEFAAE